ncbi:hypothetical protein IPO96_03865 [Candidatus Saccharibacteria bacterium]|nr:MAG: hypothetical protein IPO96_03865 [Candidatus Saccharibacteria bacterium]
MTRSPKFYSALEAEYDDILSASNGDVGAIIPCDAWRGAPNISEQVALAALAGAYGPAYETDVAFIQAALEGTLEPTQIEAVNLLERQRDGIFRQSIRDDGLATDAA